MNEFSAAIGLEQLKKLDKLNAKRCHYAKIYSKELEVEQKMPFNQDCSYHLYWIIVKNRNKFMRKMLESCIETGIHYRPIHTMSMYKNNQKLTQTEKVGKGIVSIPIHPNLSEADVDKIVHLVNRIN